jgi:membrane protease subunit (stomatin/prohibitin family)
MPAFSGGLTRGLVAGGAGQGGVGPWGTGMGMTGLGGVAGRLSQVIQKRRAKKPGGTPATDTTAAAPAAPGTVDPSIFGTGNRY